MSVTIGGVQVATVSVGGDHHQLVALPADYETVAASQTDQVLGATGATGDYLANITVYPATTTPGAVTIKDNTTTVISWTPGTLPSNIPIVLDGPGKSKNGAWKVTTGTNVSLLCRGVFT